MIQLFRLEVFKIFKRPRTYIAYAVIALIIILIQVALKFGGEEYVGLMLSGMGDSFEDIPTSDILNGYFVCFIILNLLLIHIPILVALVAGDAIAGEANMGTLRLLVTKPVSRFQLLIVKFAASSFYTILMLIWVAVLALFVSIALFGVNSLGVPRGFEFNVIEANDVMWRYMLSFCFAAIGLICVASLAFMLSVFADNAIGPIVITVCIIIVFTILTQMQIPFYDETIKPWLFTTHMLGWKGFFYVKGNEGETIKGSIENINAILKSAGILVGYTLLFLGVAFWYFKRKNILS
jgi:ABC-2 type transport system permease protein